MPDQYPSKLSKSSKIESEKMSQPTGASGDMRSKWDHRQILERKKDINVKLRKVI